MAWHLVFNCVFWINEWTWFKWLNFQGLQTLPSSWQSSEKASLLEFHSAPHPWHCPEGLIFLWHSCFCCTFLLLYSWKEGFFLHWCKTPLVLAAFTELPFQYLPSLTSVPEKHGNSEWIGKHWRDPLCLHSHLEVSSLALNQCLRF